MPNGYSKPFTNLTPEHLEPYLRVESLPTEEAAAASRDMPTPHSFEDCMKSGAQITGKCINHIE